MSSDLNSLTEAKKIYTNQLCKLLQPQIYKGMITIWALCRNTDEPLKNFQRKMENIPRWNSMIISDEYQRIVADTKCEYIDKLLDAVFIANAKVLSVLNKRKTSLDISVPTPKKFLHSCYIACAYRFYSEPFLFDDRESSGVDYRKRQKKMREILNIIQESISDTIENLLPIEDLLQKCLYNKDCDLEDDHDHDDDIFDEIEEKPHTPKLDVLDGDNLYQAHFDDVCTDDKEKDEDDTIDKDDITDKDHHNIDKNDSSDESEEDDKFKDGNDNDKFYINQLEKEDKEKEDSYDPYNKKEKEESSESDSESNSKNQPSGRLLITKEEERKLDLESIKEPDYTNEDDDNSSDDDIKDLNVSFSEYKPLDYQQKSKKISFFDDI